ncbi:SH2 domain-containing protein 3C isoform X2 [Oryzias latipes]|uniref:SH2 domain-containing protein 3C isoform X2 n=1 Tax=Oryzias latipes TaxID=8090 RepID=UPI0009DA4680|nr:SH2 domain-containing protein 3C isoform X2 [Oryzias latipes]
MVPHKERLKLSCPRLTERRRRVKPEEREAVNVERREQGELLHPPLFSALSGCSPSSMKPPEPLSGVPTPGVTSPARLLSDKPKTTATKFRTERASNTGRGPEESGTAFDKQDVYIPMDPISATAPSHKPPQTEGQQDAIKTTQESLTTDRPLSVRHEGEDGSEEPDSRSQMAPPLPAACSPAPPCFVERLQAEDFLETEPCRTWGSRVLPLVETVSSFKPSKYQSQLMLKHNKPLEVGVLRRVKELLASTDPHTAAKIITKADCEVARILGMTPELQRMMGVSCGMELLTLPHGQQLRQDLLERLQTMAITLAVHVLGCTGTHEERALLLQKIIQIAAELKSTTGNMFGFSAVMTALELPQMSRLEQTWAVLRQRHTEGAILYEKTLLPFFKSLNEGRESCPLANTTFPHILPFLTLMERSDVGSEGKEPWDMAEGGVDMVMNHLGAARTFAQLGPIYRSNAQTKLQGFQAQPEIQEIFLTDFQMRLLWGSRGSEENQALRYSKFNQVLTVLSNKLQRY